MSKTCTPYMCPLRAHLRDSAHTLAVALALLASLPLQSAALAATPTPQVAQVQPDAESEEAKEPLRAFRKPNRVPDEDAALAIRLLLILPLIALAGLILALLIKPKDNSSVFKDPTPVPRKQKGSGGSKRSGGSRRSRSDDDWGSDSSHF